MNKPASSLLEMLNANPAHLSPEELRAHIANLAKVVSSPGHLKEAIVRDSFPRKQYSGFIYVLSHPRMPGILKIGYTQGSVTDRIAHLALPPASPVSSKWKTWSLFARSLELSKRRYIDV